MPEIYALLAGVNDYTPNVGKLNGCLNDVDAFEAYIQKYFPDQSHVLTLKDSAASYQGIIDGFRTHLSQAKQDDIVIFQFSGHGARWKAAEEFAAYYPDGYDEGLVCWDSRRDPDNPEKFDLADKELGILVSEVASQGQHVLVVLDSCHSGSGTRSVGQPQSCRPRVTHQVETPRPLETYLEKFYSNQLANNQTLATPASRHILLAACERRKQAFETHHQRGFFSKILLDCLDDFGGQISYKDLFLKVRPKVRRQAIQQTPQFEAYHGFNSNAGFMGRDASQGQGSRRFHVNFELSRMKWTAECGALQGMTANPNRLPELTLYNHDHSEPIGTAKPIEINLSKSEIELDFDSPKGKVYQAEISSLPIPPLEIGVSGSPTAIELLQHVQASDHEWIHLQLIEDSGDHFDFQLVADDSRADGPTFLILESETGQIVRGFRGHNEQAAKSILMVLNQIAYWQRMLRLQNDRDLESHRRVPFQFQEVNKSGGDTSRAGSDVRLELAPDGSEVILGNLVTRNTTGQLLYSMVLYFSDKFGMRILDNDEFPPSETERKILLNGDPELELFLERDDPDQSIERFMMVVSSEPIDDLLIEPSFQRSQSSEDPDQILEDIDWGAISAPFQSRGTRFGKQKMKQVKWFTKTIEIQLQKRVGKVTTNQVAKVHDNLSVLSHPQLQANLSLAPIQPMGRSLESPDQFCRALQAQGLELVNFSNARNESISAIEFSDLQHAETLQETPLQLELAASLSEDEWILPVVYDGCSLHVVGESQTTAKAKTLVSVHSLPQPSGQRSVLNAVRLYFFKCYLKKNLSKLYCLELGDSPTAFSLNDRVAKAKNILLLIPGMLSSGEQMLQSLKSSRATPDFSTFANEETLVLSFDYEMVNTPLEESAKLLQSQLLDAGVHQPEKTVCVVGHGTGGLVARWMIEQESGKDFVDEVILLGTPQLGSPFGKIGFAKSATRMLASAALNFLPGIASTVTTLLAYLVKLDGLTVVLEQLDANGDFLKTLNQSDDPGIPYTLVAGDASQTTATHAWTSRILKAIRDSSATQLMFGGVANDLFTSIPSAHYSVARAGVAPTTIVDHCHHFGYLADLDPEPAKIELFR